MKKYGWLAVGVVLVITGVMMMMRREDRPVVDNSSAQPVQDEQRPSPIDRDLPRPTLKIVQESETVRTRIAEDSKPSTESYENTPGTNWAVVAATYRDYDAAARRASSLDDVGGIRPSVFPAKGKGTKYMVVVGQGLTRARAEALRTRAVAAGLPPDMYVTLLSE